MKKNHLYKKKIGFFNLFIFLIFFLFGFILTNKKQKFFNTSSYKQILFKILKYFDK